MKIDFPVIDFHTHLRENIPLHTKIAKENGIDIVVYMANSHPPNDTLERIKSSLSKKRYCKALPVSAITKRLKGKELVDIDKIKPYVVGFSDDGKYLADLNLLREVLEKDVLVMAHCSPDYEEGVRHPERETEYIERYINLLKKVKRGRLHIQHVSKRQSVELIRKAKRSGLRITCETCPHYFTYTRFDLETRVNPPLAEEKDVIAIRKGLADGTIDIIASDYAPLPRVTGIAGFRAFLPLCFGLVLRGVLTKKQLKEKIYLNPKELIKESGQWKNNWQL